MSRNTRPKILAQRLFDALNDEDRNAFYAIFTPAARIFNGGDETDVDTLWVAERAMFEAFPDHEHVIRATVVGEKSVAVRFTFKGTHEGTYDGIPPSGNKVSVTAQCTISCSGDAISEWRIVSDTLSFYDQLGAVEAPYDHRYEAHL
jgi:predicted ester cyclase